MSGCGRCGTHNGCTCPSPNQHLFDEFVAELPRARAPMQCLPPKRQTATEIMEEKTADEYMSWAIETAGSGSNQRLPRWSHVGDIFGNGSGVSQALCIKYGHDPDEIMGQEWTDTCPTCGTEFEL